MSISDPAQKQNLKDQPPGGGIDLSVVVVTHNVAHLIENCLNSLYRDCAGLDIEVFVVDSASTDDSVALVRKGFPQATVIASPENIGFSASNNLAIPRCQGRYVLLLNPDTVVHPGAIRDLLRYLDEHPKVGAVGPTIRLGDGRIQADCARNLPKVSNLWPWLLLLDKLEWKLRFKEGTRPTHVNPPPGTFLDRFYLLSWARDTTCETESISGACMLIRREVVRQIGLLDETSPFYLDDIDYCRRIRSAGWPIHYVSGPTITHLWQQSSGQLNRKGAFYALLCHSIWLYLRKHDGPRAGAAFTAMVALAVLIRLPVSLLGRLLPGEPRKTFWAYQWSMTLGLAKWCFRYPKAPPDLGFVLPSRQPLPQARGAALGRNS